MSYIVETLAPLLHSKYPNIPIYVNRVSKHEKENFQIVVISTNVESSHSDTIYYTNLVSVVRTSHEDNFKSLFEDLKLELTILLNEYASEIEFHVVDNQLHAMFNFDYLVEVDEDGEILYELDVETKIR